VKLSLSIERYFTLAAICDGWKYIEEGGAVEEEQLLKYARTLVPDRRI